MEGEGQDEDLVRGVLEQFDRVAEPGEPLTTAEAAAAVGGSESAVRDALVALVDLGDVRSKEVDGRRVWWRPSSSAPELTAERTRELVFRSEALARPFLAVTEESARITLDRIVPLADGAALHYVTVENVSPAAFLGVFEDLPEVIEARPLSTVGDTLRVEARTNTRTLPDLFARFGGEFRSATIEGDVFTILAVFPGDVDPVAVAESAGESFPDLRLVAQRLVYTPRLFEDVVRGSMTDRQWTALQSAYYAGYFDSPRASRGEEIAEALGVTRQTFHHHLRRAEAVVFGRLFGGVDEDAI